MANFEKIIPKILNNEGGYVNALNDSGGETNFGISDARDGKVDGMADLDSDGKGDVSIKNLKLEEATRIYKRDYWNILRCDQITSDEVALNLFDFAVNAGSVQCAKLVQRVLGAKADGVIGPATLSLINQKKELSLIKEFQKARALFYVDLVVAKPSQIKFLKGWVCRAFL